MPPKERMDEALTRLVELLEAGVRDGADFAREQVPLVLQEWLAWGLWRAALVALACTIAAVVAWRVARHFRALARPVTPTMDPDLLKGVFPDRVRCRIGCGEHPPLTCDYETCNDDYQQRAERALGRPKSSEGREGYYVGAALGYLALTGSLFAVYFYVAGIVQIVVAPRIWLIEQARDLLK